MATGILNKKLPPNMRSQFWIDLIDAIEEESNEVTKPKIAEKANLYNIEEMDYERLLEVSELLSLPFDVSINNDIEFLRQEIKAIPFRVKWKATVKLFKSFFNAIKRNGNVYVYYYDGMNLVRDTESLLYSITGHIPNLPYNHLSKDNFSGSIITQLKLDSGLKLDDGWQLDNAAVKRNTNHFALEIFLDTHFFSGTEGSAPDSGLYPSTGLAPSPSLPPSQTLAPLPRIAYLITPEFFSYLYTNVQESKKIINVVHVGCQLNCVVDNSRFYNSYGSQYTVPELLLNGVTTDFMTGVTSVDDLKYIEFGVDQRGSLPSTDLSGTQPDALREKVARIEIIAQEKWEEDDWYGVTALYHGNSINDVVVGTGDGTTTEFNKYLSYFPLKRGNITVTFISDAITYQLKDDKFGNLVGDSGEGTIDYNTGFLDMTTNLYIASTEVLGVGNNVETHFTYSNPVAKRPVKTGSVIIRYIINGTTYIATDNGSGVITGVSCTGTITYASGAFDLTFAIAPLGDISLIYEYQKIAIPDNGTDIIVDYFYENTSTYIREAGVIDSLGNLVAYATFPRISFKDFNNHLNLSFIIKKSNFV